MSEINGNFISKIKNKFNIEKDGYIKLRLEVSKIFFSVVGIIYFMAYLFTIGGLGVEYAGYIVLGMFPVLIFGVMVLTYDLLAYLFTLYTQNSNIYKMGVAIFLTVLFVIMIAINYGILNLIR